MRLFGRDPTVKSLLLYGRSLYLQKTISLLPRLVLAGLLSLPVAAQSDTELTLARVRMMSSFEREIRPWLSNYCTACHGPTKAKADLNLSLIGSGEQALAKPFLWKDCAARVQSMEMPPKKEPNQPSAQDRARFVAWVEGLKKLQPKDPGKGTIRRLSQVEYANTLGELLGVDPRIADEIPRDVVGAGFNSSIPPLLMEKYLAVAEAALDEVLKPEQLKVKWNGGQLEAIVDGKRTAGTPDGAERKITGPGEVSASFIAPVEGSYTILLKAAAEKAASREPCRVGFRVNGEVVGESKVTALPAAPGLYTVTCKLSTGNAALSVALANPFVDTAPEPKKPAPPPPPGAKVDPAPPVDTKPAPRTLVVSSIEVTGPPASRGTPMQKKLLVAVPAKALAPRDAARKVADTFARRAFRRPPQPAEIEHLLKVFDLADRKGAGYTESVRLMLKAVLVSPEFLYLTPDDGVAPGPDGIVVLGDHQLASRLSYLFWSTMPDDELSGLADAGKLREPAVIAAQVRRLIADPRSRALFDGFGASWLGVDRLIDLEVDEKKFPLMTKPMRRAMLDEAALLFDGILRGDRPILEFIDSNYTFMNDMLARIYGMESAVKGPKMVRVALTDKNRGGILTLPGVLAVTSLPNRTSPVKRGRWVLEQVLGQTPPSPPANVPPLERQDTPSAASLNLRKRMEQHRSNPACLGCHQTIDPIGFGLENFDVVGRWRDRDDTGAAVDSQGELPGEIVFAGPADLKAILVARKTEFCRNLVRRVLAYTLCRSLSGYDEIVADEISDEVAKDGYRFQTLWVKVATSYPFLNRKISR
ncbi:MAG TPA: DUF1592 domain-containing protein [Planctomycetota bacterium]|nr:DUF1592 domain-containing protein [Planctomycetota bacterium]